MVKDLDFPLERNNYIEYHHQMWSLDESTQKQEHSSIISEHRPKSARLQKGPDSFLFWLTFVVVASLTTNSSGLNTLPCLNQ